MDCELQGIKAIMKMLIIKSNNMQVRSKGALYAWLCIFTLLQHTMNADAMEKHVKHHIDTKYHSAKIHSWAVKLQDSEHFYYYSSRCEHIKNIANSVSRAIADRLNGGLLSNSKIRASVVFYPMEYLQHFDIYMLELRLNNIPVSNVKETGASDAETKPSLGKVSRSQNAKVSQFDSSQKPLKKETFLYPKSVIKLTKHDSQGVFPESSQKSYIENTFLFLHSKTFKKQTMDMDSKSHKYQLIGDNIRTENEDILSKPGGREDLYLNSSTYLREVIQTVHHIMDVSPEVLWYSQQVIRPRVKRSWNFKDPAYPRQWHLHNEVNPQMDINVQEVWSRNISGRGVTVVVVDDGLEWTNPDIQDNYSPQGSWDLNSHDSDPMPAINKDKNHHGTRCAGEIGAVANSVCAVGVAFQAKVAGIRVLDGPMTDSLEATAFNKNMEVNDIYSCSWGPDDDGKTVDGPHILAQTAMEKGVNFGRQGYGSIYVVASGNGGFHGDNCNFDGYANSVYTVTIGAVDELGNMPYYAEECASMLAVTFSSGGPGLRNVVTTDWMVRGGTGCTDEHSGTSAAAPLAAGMIALMLQARSCLTWRDVQHIIVMTAVKVDEQAGHFTTNQAGLHHSHKHGFGLLDAWRLVNAAKVWDPVPWMSTYSSPEVTVHTKIPRHPQVLELNMTVSEEVLAGYNLFLLEHVQVTVTLSHPHRGSLDIHVTCPSGTDSVIATPRPKDSSSDGFQGWTFSTVRCWGENPVGIWKLKVTDRGNHIFPFGIFEKWQLVLFGSQMNRGNFEARKRLISDAVSGRYLYDNFTKPCPPPPANQGPEASIPPKTLKIILLIGVFCFLVALYDTFEYMFCYNDEKKAALVQPGSAGSMATSGSRVNNSHVNNPGNRGSEYARLLSNIEENIPMVEMPRNIPDRTSADCQSSFHDNSSYDSTREADSGQNSHHNFSQYQHNSNADSSVLYDSEVDGDLGLGSTRQNTKSVGAFSQAANIERSGKETGIQKWKKTMSKLSMGKFEEVSLLSSPDGDVSE
ncbi:proprotein convertase subtilisin/kexin type 7 isoform X1 [Lingula anatina]|uniref:Proprotein convertase subtilisin/kexin type 7 isoform X1 n=1 Tax=Lingula anatina TaxID=7574 RepID=A0A1S3J2F9_LINAN|nr:proprotein convertase subtilisin/kexin type 7 isoform X1 [Lingula anatina]|eukprot:XP_013404597.1 proprotein convertase subtilisin/kexin type 7 isoform X1 [Lingula anatina]